jgi:hypothetical protein
MTCLPLTVQRGHRVVVHVVRRLDDHDGHDEEEADRGVLAVNQVAVQGQPAAGKEMKKVKRLGTILKNKEQF